MKPLLRLFFVLALLFGSAGFGRAQNFHVKVLDPANFCISDPSACAIFDTSAPFTATFSASTCALAGVPGLPSDPTTYGCLALFNATTDPITSLNLNFSDLGPVTYECDTTGSNVMFSGASCGPLGDTDNFYFYDGVFDPFQLAIVYETGANPNLFDGTGTVNTPAPVPEPASLPLLLTGILGAGIFLGRRGTLFATANQ